MPIYFGSNFAREPFQFDSVGNDWEQESVTRPEGYPLYHYCLLYTSDAADD